MGMLARLSTSAAALLRRDPRVSAAVAGTALAILGAVVLGRVRRARAYSAGTAIISGASSGIGAAVARLLAARGSHVVLLARSAAPLEALAAEITKAGGSASWHAVDCANGAAVDAVAAEVLAKRGPPSLVVCSAGAGQWKTLWEMRTDEITRTLDAPLLAAAFVSRAFLPAMLAARLPSGVVFVQSPAGCVRYCEASQSVHLPLLPPPPPLQLDPVGWLYDVRDMPRRAAHARRRAPARRRRRPRG